MYKIAFFELEGWEGRMIKKNFPGAELHLSRDKIDQVSVPRAADFEILSVFVNSRLEKKILERFPHLKLIATRSTGFDHIDLTACRKRDISVAYVPGYGANTVAEFAFGLILNLTRKIYAAIDQIKERESFGLEGLRGTDLKGKTIGIIGTGAIGKEMVKIAQGFGMKVIASDPYPSKDFSQARGFSYLSLEELLGEAEIISIHAPYNKSTHHLLNRGNIRLIKKGAYLINTARGGIVETAALVEALRVGILAGAGLDVLEEEGEIKDELKFLAEGKLRGKELQTMLENHVLMKMPNVLITPHNAFNSQEALERIVKITIENIQGFLAGQPVNLVPKS